MMLCMLEVVETVIYVVEVVDSVAAGAARGGAELTGGVLPGLDPSYAWASSGLGTILIWY